jgi:hypothetical protein
MKEEVICILCERNAEKAHIPDKVGYFIKCDICGEYFLASPEIFESSYTDLPREKRAMISSYTRDCFEHSKEPPQLEDAGYLSGIITEYENKSFDDKIKNLILFIRKKSPELGYNVLLEAQKDYPVTYSVDPGGFKEVLNNAVEQRLVRSIESGFELTEQGYALGTELM